jgi:cytochrome P450
MLLLILLVLLLLLLLLRWWARSRLPASFPPGPAPLPFIGNIHQVGFDLKTAFDGWRRRHGSIVGFQLGGQPSVVISDFDVLNEAFKDDRFCGRPANLQEIFAAFFSSGRGEKSTGGIVFSHGEYWREQRKFAMKTLKDFGVGKSNLQTVINDEVAKLVDELRDDVGQPVDLRLRTNLAVVNSLWQILNGEKSDLKNPKMRRVFKATTEFIVSNSLSGPVMIMPWLRHLPFFNGRFEAARRSPQEMREVTSASIQAHRDTYQEEHQRDFIDCYIKKMRETTDADSSFYGAQGEGNIQRTLMDLFGAGSETTSSILYFAFNYLIRYPAMQARVHAEIDAVIGSRTPLLEDRPGMPYTDALIHEVLRHSCIVYTTPHATTEEVELSGYTLPAGTAVYANVWWIMNDPAHWERPEAFMPERFLDAAGRFRKNERCIPFLVGKRYCLGQQLAQHELFLFLTGLLQKFSFRTPLADPSLVNTEPEVGFMHTCPTYNVLLAERT